jgi:hypothetical protein
VVSEVADKIKSRAHWEVFIHPAEFVEQRVPYSALERLLPDAVVRLRGWPVPYIDYQQQFGGDANSIAQDIDARTVDHLECWRLWTSGQFAQLRSVGADWRDGTDATRVPVGYDGVIETWEILYYVTEVFELASRLSLTNLGDERMVVNMSLNGISNRALVVGLQGRAPFMTPPRSRVPAFTWEQTILKDQLLASSTELARAFSLEFFNRFGWNPSDDLLSDLQNQLLTGR